MPTNDNVLILERMRGVPSQPATPESDADPLNPHVRDERDARIADLEAALLGLHQLVEGVLDHTLPANSELGRWRSSVSRSAASSRVQPRARSLIVSPRSQQRHHHSANHEPDR